MTLDTKAVTVPENIRILASAITIDSKINNQQKAFDVLRSWNGLNELRQIGPTIYNKFIYFYLKNTFQDEIGNDNFKALLVTHVIKQTINAQLKNQNSPWWDNVHTKNKVETRAEIISKSFGEAVASLEIQLGRNVNSWTWNRAHTLEMQHPIGKVKLFKRFFNVAPMGIAGSCEVLNNMIFTYSDNQVNEVKAGQSARRVIDFSDVENSVSILPSGQSGNPMSKHYSDQAQMYTDGKFRKMKMNKDEIIKTSTKLVFIPAKG